MFVYKNNNHKNKRTGDCTIRAFMEIVDESPEEILKELVNIYLKTGYFIDDPKGYDKWLNSKGYVKQRQARKIDNKMYKADQTIIPLLQKKLPFSDDCKNGLKFVNLDTDNPKKPKKYRSSENSSYSRSSSVYS